MRMENSNSGIHVLVLARPADSMCAILASALRQWHYTFSVCSTVYEVVNRVNDISAGQLPVLIVRPAMLGPQAALFLECQFPDLRIIGWVDSGENAADCAITRTMVSGRVMVSHSDQIQQVLRSFCETKSRRRTVSNAAGSDILKESDRLEYELSDDEVTALLGVE